MQRGLVPRWLLWALALTVLLSGCHARDPLPEPSPHPVPDGTQMLSIQEQPVPIAQQMIGQTGIMTVVVTDEGLAPNHLVSRLGDRVKLHLQNRGTKPLHFRFPRWGIVTDPVPPGGDDYVEFTAGEKGSWPYYSEVDGQEKQIAPGILSVE